MAYTLIEKDGYYTLENDGKTCDCPYSGIVLVPTQVGGVNMTRMPCNSGCAQFEKTDSANDGSTGVQLHCSGRKLIANVKSEKKSNLRIF